MLCKIMAIPCEMLLHPELLSNEQLIRIVQERQLHIANIENMPRDELLDLFHHYCVPYGQRKYRDSGRGKILNRNRNLSPESTKNVSNDCQTRKLSHASNCERLKPPPDLLAGHIKRIKIDNIMEPMYKDAVNMCKRKMSLDPLYATPPATDSPPPKKVKTPITWP